MNKNVDQRDNMLFGEPYNEDHYCGGCRWFDEISLETLKWLVSEGYADTEEAQNSSPSIGEFIEETNGFEDSVTFDGYAVSPKRDDYRVSIDSVNVEIPFDQPDMLAHFTEAFHFADEFNISPDNLRKEYMLRAWWD